MCPLRYFCGNVFYSRLLQYMCWKWEIVNHSQCLLRILDAQPVWRRFLNLSSPSQGLNMDHQIMRPEFYLWATVPHKASYFSPADAYENIVAKGEIARFEQFLLLSLWFSKILLHKHQKASIWGKGLKITLGKPLMVTWISSDVLSLENLKCQNGLMV